MSRVTALESSLVLAASGAILALGVEIPAVGPTLELAGWLLLMAGAWSFVLALLVGTSATTSIDTTFDDRQPHYARRDAVPAPIVVRHHHPRIGLRLRRH
jgi:hypothetical protein